MIQVCNVDEEGRFGGPERRIVQVAGALKKHGVNTHVVYSKYDSQIFSQELRKAGISSSALAITRLSKEKKILLRYIIYFLIEIYRLRTFFKKNKFDLIHVNGSYQFKVAIAGKLSGIPVIWHLNDTYVPKSLKAVFSFTARHCADGFIVAGRRVYDYYLKNTILAVRPVVEIHAPVDFKLFNPSKYSTRNKEKTGKTIIGTVSGVNPAKGLIYFVKMAANLLRSEKNIRFVIAGAVLSSQKEYYNKVLSIIKEKGIGEKVELCGFVSDIPKFLSKIDICVFTSIVEASPTSIWEAMAMSKPIVTTDVGSVKQFIRDNVSGFIVPVEDTDALCERVKKLINDPFLQKKFSVNARATANSELNIQSAAQKHYDSYRTILNPPASLSF